MRKKIFILITLFLISFSFIFSKEIPRSMGIKIDVKTHLKEKLKLRAIKEGVIYYLKKSGFEVVENGEDYAMWLEDFSEKRVFVNKYEVKITVKITPPTAFTEKPPIFEKRYKIEYKYNPDLVDVDETDFIKYIKEKIKNIKEKDTIKGEYIGKKIAYDIYFMFKEGKIVNNGGKTKI